MYFTPSLSSTSVVILTLAVKAHTFHLVSHKLPHCSFGTVSMLVWLMSWWWSFLEDHQALSLLHLLKGSAGKNPPLACIVIFSNVLMCLFCGNQIVVRLIWPSCFQKGWDEDPRRQKERGTMPVTTRMIYWTALNGCFDIFLVTMLSSSWLMFNQISHVLSWQQHEVFHLILVSLLVGTWSQGSVTFEEKG